MKNLRFGLTEQAACRIAIRTGPVRVWRRSSVFASHRGATGRPRISRATVIQRRQLAANDQGGDDDCRRAARHHGTHVHGPGRIVARACRAISVCKALFVDKATVLSSAAGLGRVAQCSRGTGRCPVSPVAHPAHLRPGPPAPAWPVPASSRAARGLSLHRRGRSGHRGR
jgi:hypothetical protein